LNPSLFFRFRPVFSLWGSLKFQMVPALNPVVNQIIESRALRVVVDLSQLDIIDSSGIAVIVKLYKGIKTYNGVLTVSGAKDQPLSILKLLRLDKVFL